MSIQLFNPVTTKAQRNMKIPEQIKRASVCQRQGYVTSTYTVHPNHKHAHLFRSTCTHSACTHEHTCCDTPRAQATFHILHFTGRIQWNQTSKPCFCKSVQRPVQKTFLPLVTTTSKLCYYCNTAAHPVSSRTQGIQWWKIDKWQVGVSLFSVSLILTN